mmetsp:Transcript_96858/g.172380  ORF Transcript_96858/g.172380 Transcript_96858/m.172380 type:complete len:589 (+) Transcript_96858:77-1843(+)|eukprot:CAMPEP_0197655572 /NCGR_PEP_ID=MMETSP1338-20131121/39529_1 /TAXON_ID=43686 ORGANISM="Pelagodinium beii, Strain RCC1491" /NCGR_SAMPLE_ID=MMETSP1338 /ASSEMBLY_ACC=CAM_ASM_000754 /LENGTH=588 /DNA_ID=CAMNT_0043231239 /DNA_START=68 /DNA_END=1834 /DNA_ORIENTATION=-
MSAVDVKVQDAADNEPAVPELHKTATFAGKEVDFAAFRVCDVYHAPRLPHALAEDWNPILKSAEDLKFGRFKGHEQPGKGKFVVKKPESPQAANLPKRPRVPPAPRPKPRPPELNTAEMDLSDSKADASVEGDESHAPSPKVSPRTLKNQEARAQAKKRVQARERQEAESETEKQAPRSARLSKTEFQTCQWCGQLEAPEHPKQCKLRQVDCKHCGQKLAFAALRQHLKVCPERPITKSELFRTKSSTRNQGSESGTVTPDFTTDATRLLTSLRSKIESFQESVNAVSKKVMLDEDESSQEVKELMGTFDSMAHQLALLELTAKSGESLTSQQPVVPEELQAPEDDDEEEDVMDVLVDLQRRFSLFQMMLRAIAEDVEKEEPQKPSALGAAVTPPSGGKRPPSVVDAIFSSSAETPRSHRPGLQLSPLRSRTRAPSRTESRASSRADSVGSRGRSNSRLGSRSKVSTTSRVSTTQDRSSSRSRRAQEAQEQPKLVGPGPAAVGYREMTVEEMKKEIEQERQRYIAQGLQVLAKQQRDRDEVQGSRRSSVSGSRRNSMTPTGRRASSAHSEAGPLMPTAAELKQRLQQR